MSTPDTAPEGYVFMLAQPVIVAGRALYHTMPVCGWFEKRADAARIASHFQPDSGVTPILIQLPEVVQEVA